jgi:hypothetical protein
VDQARVLATLRRDQEARRCLAEAEATFQAMPASSLADPALGYTERQFHWIVSNAYTRLGMTKEADAMQRQALDMYQPTRRRPAEYLAPALIQLDQAQCMVKQGDIVSACEYALRTITSVPSEHQGLVKHYGRGFLAQLPDPNRHLTPARELRELLATVS